MRTTTNKDDGDCPNPQQKTPALTPAFLFQLFPICARMLAIVAE